MPPPAPPSAPSGFPRAAAPAIDERRLLVLLGAVQFINVLEFMMVMPLGPFFSRALRFPANELGLVAGSYTAAAAVAGILGSRFLDRFDRRRALAVAMIGLVAGTALGGCAVDLRSMIAARVVAGAFGGPASALTLSIVADVVPPERRGRSLGALMGANSIAQVLGVPTGLWLAELGSWRAPFLSVGGFGLLLAGAAVWVLPPLRGHLDGGVAVAPGSHPSPWRRPTVRVSWSMTLLLMMGNFALIPLIAPYVVNNHHFPKEGLKQLYLVGGVVGFGAMRLVGRLVDRAGELVVGAFGTALFVSTVAVGFYFEQPVPAMALYLAFILSMSFRAVPIVTLTSKVPKPWERGGFMSGQSAMSHIGSSAGTIIASRLVSAASETAPLVGVPRVSVLTMSLALAALMFLWGLTVRLRAGAD